MVQKMRRITECEMLYCRSVTHLFTAFEHVCTFLTWQQTHRMMYRKMVLSPIVISHDDEWAAL